MTIARRRRTIIDAIAPSLPSTPPAPPPMPEPRVSLPLGDVPAPDTVTPFGRLRRCTFRRIDRVQALPGRSRSTYEVMCLYHGSADDPLALGDVGQARSVCAACTASGIFRPDEA